MNIFLLRPQTLTYDFEPQQPMQGQGKFLFEIYGHKYSI